jgi:hypothetical protein
MPDQGGSIISKATAIYGRLLRIHTAIISSNEVKMPRI